MEKELNQYFDHTLLAPEATESHIQRLCREAREYGFYSVCVNPCYVSLAKQELEGSNVKIACVVGFPLGACECAGKVFETAGAVEDGADEIDMVLNIGFLKDGKWEQVQSEIAAVVQEAAKGSAIVKVILETCLLSDSEIVEACHLAEAAKAVFVKTSTGFSKGGASVDHVALMKQTVGDRLQVKASGGIRDLKTALAMIEAGADRLGASASVSIMEEAKAGLTD